MSRNSSHEQKIVPATSVIVPTMSVDRRRYAIPAPIATSANRNRNHISERNNQSKVVGSRIPSLPSSHGLVEPAPTGS